MFDSLMNIINKVKNKVTGNMEFGTPKPVSPMTFPKSNPQKRR
jgi:hypothetical protein